MAGTAVLGRLTRQVAEVVDVVAETRRVKTLAFDVPGWPGHRAGQRVDVRPTAEDGYQARRSYADPRELRPGSWPGSSTGATRVREDQASWRRQPEGFQVAGRR